MKGGCKVVLGVVTFVTLFCGDTALREVPVKESYVQESISSLSLASYGKNGTSSNIDFEELEKIVAIAGPIVIVLMFCVTICSLCIAVLICLRLFRREPYERIEHTLDDEELAFQNREFGMNHREMEDIFGVGEEDADDTKLEFDAHELEQMQMMEVNQFQSGNLTGAPDSFPVEVSSAEVKPRIVDSTPIVKVPGPPTPSQTVGSAPAAELRSPVEATPRSQHGGGWKDDLDYDMEYELGEEYDVGSAADSNLSFEIGSDDEFK